jgi:hypothetical protein
VRRELGHPVEDLLNAPAMRARNMVHRFKVESRLPYDDDVPGGRASVEQFPSPYYNKTRGGKNGGTISTPLYPSSPDRGWEAKMQNGSPNSLSPQKAGMGGGYFSPGMFDSPGGRGARVSHDRSPQTNLPILR